MITTWYFLLVWITAILIGSLSLVIYIGSKNHSSRVFSVGIFFVALWTATIGFFLSTNTVEIAYISNRLSYVWGILIACSMFSFSLVFPDDKRINAFWTNTLGLLSTVFTYLYLYTDWMIKNIYPITPSILNGSWLW